MSTCSKLAKAAQPRATPLIPGGRSFNASRAAVLSDSRGSRVPLVAACGSRVASAAAGGSAAITGAAAHRGSPVALAALGLACAACLQGCPAYLWLPTTCRMAVRRRRICCLNCDGAYAAESRSIARAQRPNHSFRPDDKTDLAPHARPATCLGHPRRLPAPPDGREPEHSQDRPFGENRDRRAVAATH